MSATPLHDDPELRAALCRAVDGGPPLLPPTEVLIRAQQTRRRRRVAGAAVGLAATALLGGVALATTGAPSDDGRGAVIADRPAEPTASPDLGVRVTRDGSLVAEGGTTIVDRVVEPLERRPGGRSWGVVTEHDSTEVWGLVDWSRAGTMISVEPAEARFAAFEDWLAYEVSAATGDPMPDPVHFDQDGVLRPNGATRLVQQRSEVDLGRWSGPDVLTAAAEIRTGADHQFVLARHAAGGAPTYVVLEADAQTATFDGLLQRAAELYDAYEGVR